MPVQVGVNCWKIEVWPSPSDVVMSFLRNQTPVHCIPYPYHMYTQCFSTDWFLSCVVQNVTLIPLWCLTYWSVESPSCIMSYPSSIDLVICFLCFVHCRVLVAQRLDRVNPPQHLGCNEHPRMLSKGESSYC